MEPTVPVISRNFFFIPMGHLSYRVPKKNEVKLSLSFNFKLLYVDEIKDITTPASPYGVYMSP